MKLQKTFYDLLKNKTDYAFFCPLPPFAKAPYLVLQSIEREEGAYQDSKIHPYKAIFMIKDQEASNKRLLQNLVTIQELLMTLPFKGLRFDSKIKDGAQITLHFFYEEK